jgi:crossover junction endonuclease MUS81
MNNTNYILKIDNRENELIKLYKERDNQFSLENLDVGDIQIIDCETNEIVIIIERKSFSDLSNSIKDGRYKEQKERLIHSIKSNVRKILLIEGDNMKDFTLSLKTFQSVIINTLLRDNIHIHLTKNIEETKEFIDNIMVNISKYYEDLKKEIIKNEMKTFENKYNCKTSKKENVSFEICFRNMLSQIPGVSNAMAIKIVEKYKNMEFFIKELSKYNETDRIKILSEEKYGTSNRRIGIKVSQKIQQFMFQKN